MITSFRDSEELILLSFLLNLLLESATPDFRLVPEGRALEQDGSYLDAVIFPGFAMT